jgi:hypothetical protein
MSRHRHSLPRIIVIVVAISTMAGCDGDRSESGSDGDVDDAAVKELVCGVDAPDELDIPWPDLAGAGVVVQDCIVEDVDGRRMATLGVLGRSGFFLLHVPLRDSAELRSALSHTETFTPGGIAFLFAPAEFTTLYFKAGTTIGLIEILASASLDDPATATAMQLIDSMAA